MSVIPSPRRHHTDLQPLAVRPGTPITPGRKRSNQISGSLGRSTPVIPSPSIVAARAYYLQQATPIGTHTDASQRRRILIEEHQLPRRHSVVSSTDGLTAQLEKFTFSPPSRQLQTVPEGDETGPKIKVEQGDDVDMIESIESDEVEEEAEVQSKSDLLCGTPQEVLRQVPFQYTHNHLRDWGHAYLGKSATADAFVNAVSLRRPSLVVLQDDSKCAPSSQVTIRARITPRAKERKPFLIQRQFDIEELRASIPAPNSRANSVSSSPRPLRRSSRVRRQSVQPSVAVTRQRNSLDIPAAESIPHLGKGPVPIRKSHSSALLKSTSSNKYHRHRIRAPLSPRSRRPDALRPRPERRLH